MMPGIDDRTIGTLYQFASLHNSYSFKTERNCGVSLFLRCPKIFLEEENVSTGDSFQL